jgi:alkanesulfonate monooxygenase SsuD/methylene tetrahydromethanopterin reductase-like flavin-dependent oxidoreductase (luciferase family)
MRSVTTVDIQFSPAAASWREIRAAALAAEEQGYGAVWVFDHLAGVSLGGSSMLECCSLLGALAEATTTIELGTMVANVWNREPGTLVTAAATVVELAGGRQVHLGLGAGSSPASSFAHEQRVTGGTIAPDIADRHARVAEVIDLARRTWHPDRPDDLATFPFPDPRPVVLVGTNSPALSRLAGRSADGINVPWRHARRDELLAAASDAAGDRPFSRTTYVLFDPDLLDPTHPDRVEMSSLGIDRLVLTELGPPRI